MRSGSGWEAAGKRERNRKQQSNPQQRQRHKQDTTETAEKAFGERMPSTLCMHRSAARPPQMLAALCISLLSAACVLVCLTTCCSCRFMQSSASTSTPLYISPFVSSTLTLCPSHSWSNFTGTPIVVGIADKEKRKGEALRQTAEQEDTRQRKGDKADERAMHHTTALAMQCRSSCFSANFKCVFIGCKLKRDSYGTANFRQQSAL